MQPLFDLRDLSILSLISNLLLVGALLLSRRVGKDNPSIAAWIGGAAQLATGFLLIGLRNALPDVLSIVVANALLAGGFCWLYFAMRRMLGLPRGPRWDVATGLGIAASFVYFTYVAPNLAARIVIVSGVFVAVGIAYARLLLFSDAARRDPDRGALTAIGLGTLPFTAVSALRVALTLLDPPAGDFLALTDTIHRAIFLAILLFNFTLIFGLLYLFSMRAQRRLHASEARYAATFEQAAAGIGLFDLDGRWRQANRRLCEILGYDEAELLTVRFQDTTHPDDLAVSETDRTDLLAGRCPTVTREKRYLRKDGSAVWTRRSTALIRNSDGSPDHFISVIEDIQARKAAEEKLRAAQAATLDGAEQSRRAALNLMEDALAARDAAEAASAALRESEAIYRSLFENMLNGFAHCRMLYEDGRPVDFIYLNANAAFEQQTGLRDVVGRRVSEVIPGFGETSRDLLEIYGRVARSGAPERFEIWVEGLARWFAVSVYCTRPDEFVALFDVITERKQAEIAIRESEHRFHDIVEASADWIWEVDIEGRYTYASDSVERLLGYVPEEVLGKTPFDFMPPDEAERVRKEFLAIAQHKAPFRDLDNINLHKDGRERHVWTSGMPILADDGTLLGYRGLDRDITERKLAEKALRDAHERQRTLIDALPDLIWLKDPDSVYLACNRRFEEFFGATEAEIVGKTDHDFVPRELADFFRARDRAALAADGLSVNEEEVSFASDGHREMLQTIKTPLRDSDGRLVGVLGIARDITAIKASEAALRGRERYIRALFDNFPFMVWLKDRDSRFLVVNQALVGVAGAAGVDAVLGKTDADFWPPDIADRFRADDRAVLDSGRSRTVEEEISEPGRRYWLETFKSPVELDGAIIGTVGFARDITERKAADAELKARNDELERFNRASIGRELDMIALKVQINALAQELGREPPCPLGFLDETGGTP